MVGKGYIHGMLSLSHTIYHNRKIRIAKSKNFKSEIQIIKFKIAKKIRKRLHKLIHNLIYQKPSIIIAKYLYTKNIQKKPKIAIKFQYLASIA